MQVGIIGTGHIGGNVARRLALAGHDIVVSFAQDRAKLTAIAKEIGGRAGDPADAARAEVVVLSVPWGVIGEALDAAGSLDGRVVVDTTNQFSRGGPVDLGGRTAARVNADRMPGARYTKCFNTLTAGFQAVVAGRTGDARVVQWIAADDHDATAIVSGLVDDAGYAPVLLAGIDTCAVMEAPAGPARCTARSIGCRTRLQSSTRCGRDGRSRPRRPTRHDERQTGGHRASATPLEAFRDGTATDTGALIRVWRERRRPRSSQLWFLTQALDGASRIHDAGGSLL